MLLLWPDSLCDLHDEGSVSLGKVAVLIAAGGFWLLWLFDGWRVLRPKAAYRETLPCAGGRKEVREYHKVVPV